MARVHILQNRINTLSGCQVSNICMAWWRSACIYGAWCGVRIRVGIDECGLPTPNRASLSTILVVLDIAINNIGVYDNIPKRNSDNIWWSCIRVMLSRIFVCRATPRPDCISSKDLIRFSAGRKRNHVTIYRCQKLGALSSIRIAGEALTIEFRELASHIDAILGLINYCPGLCPEYSIEHSMQFFVMSFLWRFVYKLDQDSQIAMLREVCTSRPSSRCILLYPIRISQRFDNRLGSETNAWSTWRERWCL